ncbi:hypothetical protein F8388_011400 [Cannabis sativa]|uniref:Myosin motor domain-containing protein n=1 Tax=Cannabis sativa TaxID=3483 RepID=A0A7J6EVW2_CANSA|nr:hypothetical protein F8388_011400 [Cannabis sativa]
MLFLLDQNLIIRLVKSYLILTTALNLRFGIRKLQLCFGSRHDDRLIIYWYVCIRKNYEKPGGIIALLDEACMLETLSVTEPHYIRCVKPNNLLKPSIFENSNILQQLHCGVMEAIRISCAGYPTRKPFREFVGRFGILDPNVFAGR